MNITTNGQRRTIPDGTTVLELLNELGLPPAVTVVQRNDDIVERPTYGDTLITEGDVLELVRIVGGG